jgi:ssDNA-binding Zn-finger/Zn-ribbon topoisomerase 1
LNAKFAKKEVKDQVIRADQLVTLINKLNDESKNITSTEKEMKDLAEFFLSQNVPRKSDYTKKYEELLHEVEKAHITPEEEKIVEEKTIENAEEHEKTIAEEKICPRCGNKLVLRTAKKGENVGNQFYGCSNFPTCRYIENL